MSTSQRHRRLHRPFRRAALLAASLLAISPIAAPAEDGDYTPEFTAGGALILPEHEIWRMWPYVGAPLTPNALNGGEAPFPEFHSVYIDPVSWAHWRETGEFRDGTVLAKELVTLYDTDALPDGSTQQVRGRGYFMGDFAGFEIAYKSAEHFPDAPGNWAYFSFGHHAPPYAAAIPAMPTETCSACHESNAAQTSSSRSSTRSCGRPSRRTEAGRGRRSLASSAADRARLHQRPRLPRRKS